MSPATRSKSSRFGSAGADQSRRCAQFTLCRRECVDDRGLLIHQLAKQLGSHFGIRAIRGSIEVAKQRCDLMSRGGELRGFLSRHRIGALPERIALGEQTLQPCQQFTL